MSPAFAHFPPARSTRSSTMSSSAQRLAARARKASVNASGDSDKDRKRQKNDPSVSASRTAVPGPSSVADRVLAAEKRMSSRISKELWFDPPVTHVYDPLQYAWDTHKWYTKEYGNSRKEILLVGMNPGPWGMAQSGIPFGEVNAVRDYLKVPPTITIGKPEKEHPKRPVGGLNCSRSEVSGHRLWNEWARVVHGDDPHAFFDRYFVYSYCPLLFLEASGRNRTPNLIHAYERMKVTQICDEALREVVRALRPRMVVGIGGWATERSRVALKEMIKDGLLISNVLHPSPSSPQANQGWAKVAKRRMQELIAEMSASEDYWAPKGDS